MRALRTATLSTALALATAAAARATPADAFCGFYVAGSDAQLLNRATMVVLMRDGTRTVLSMQNHYEGPPEDFALVVPVPVVLERENVKTLPRDVFDHVERLAAPRLVEYWEQDPCPTQGANEGTIGLGSIGAIGHGSGQGYGSGAGRGLGVTVEARFEVGEYDVVVLGARDSAGLDAWLRQERYRIPAGAAPVLEPYVRAGMKFFVARVNTSRVRFESGRARLSPLRFHYDSDAFSLPIRLGLLNSPGTQDLVVHVVARNQRYEVANRPNVTIPTNLDVDDGVRARFGEFYAALFDATLARRPGAVVTEYAWDSNACDPCPVPALGESDLVTLGADVLPSTAAYFAPANPNAPVPPVARVRAAPPAVDGRLSPEAIRRVVLRNLGQFVACVQPTAGQQPGPLGRVVVQWEIGANGLVRGATPGAAMTPGLERVAACMAGAARRLQFPSPEGGTVQVTYPFNITLETGRRVPFGVLQGFVLTRLHARYGRDVGEDLVFREAGGIMGGREIRGADGALEQGAQPSATNTFQARYAIRHRWTGPVACSNPQYGVWGPPPLGVEGSNAPRAAVDTAFAQRGGVQLASLVRQPVPELGVAPDARRDGPAADAGARGANPRREPPPQRAGALRRARTWFGCGRSHRSSEGARPVGALAVTAALAGAARRRKR